MIRAWRIRAEEERGAQQPAAADAGVVSTLPPWLDLFRGGIQDASGHCRPIEPQGRQGLVSAPPPSRTHTHTCFGGGCSGSRAAFVSDDSVLIEAPLASKPPSYIPLTLAHDDPYIHTN
jgi:hypothetical protein